MLIIKVIIMFILCICSYIIGKENGNEETTRLIKQYWEESKDIDDFWFKFSILWKNNIEN